MAPVHSTALLFVHICLWSRCFGVWCLGLIFLYNSLCPFWFSNDLAERERERAFVCFTLIEFFILCVCLCYKRASEYDREIPHSYIADQPTAL